MWNPVYGHLSFPSLVVVKFVMTKDGLVCPLKSCRRGGRAGSPSLLCLEQVGLLFCFSVSLPLDYLQSVKLLMGQALERNGSCMGYDIKSWQLFQIFEFKNQREVVTD